MKKVLVILSCFALVLVLSGCGEKTAEKTAEKAIEKSTNGQVDVDIDDNTISVNTNEGSMQAGEEVSLPAGFPSDVHVVDGTITMATNVTENDMYTVSVQTTKSVAAVKAEYDAQLVKDGWTIAASTAILDGALISATKGENRSISVSMGESEGYTFVTIGTSTDQE